MSGLEVNKIIASIILAVLIVLIISYVSNIITGKDKETKKNAYLIELPEKNEAQFNSNTAMTNEIETISSLLTNASIDKGEKIYKKCGSCHNYKKDSSNKVGPSLWNIINRPKANLEGFPYSKALAESEGVWNFEELAAFLYKPKDYIIGTKMNFAGLKNVEDRANLVIFLREQSDNPVPLP